MIRLILEAPTVEAARLGIPTRSTLDLQELAGATEAFSAYNWKLQSPTGTVLHAGKIREYPRAAGAWALVCRVLQDLAAQEARAHGIPPRHG